MPNTREKLIELLQSAPTDIIGNHGVGALADHLIAHGVTVQEGKPLEAFLHPVVAHEGLKAKYLVFGAASGKEIKNCFVLRPDKDPAAVEALRAYASATDNETLAEDIYNWVGKGEPVQEWISVKDRWPEENGIYLTCNKKRQYEFHMFQPGKSVWQGIWAGDGVTHWMPLPEPPKGE